MEKESPKHRRKEQGKLKSHDPMEHNMHLSRLAAVGQMAAGIVHEVRNPLTSVKGFLQLLQKQSPHPYLDIAQRELENAISTLQNLLHVAKQDVDDEPFQKVNLCTEIESILNLFQEQFYKVTLIKDFQDTDVEIYGKRNQLKKAFFNILKNAVEAIPEKGSITVKHFCRDGVVNVMISDTGVGIPKEKMMLLGTPFFTTKEEGTGMGLAQVFSAIYQHGGTVNVESEESKGTTFLLQFPLNWDQHKGVIDIDLRYEREMSLQEFLSTNKEMFEDMLLREISHVKATVQQSEHHNEIDLLTDAHRLVQFVVGNNYNEIIHFAREQGQIWAQNTSWDLSLKMEWFQAIRHVLRDFLYNYHRLKDNGRTSLKDFYSLERQISEMLDLFYRHFFAAYTEYKDNLIKSQQEQIDELCVSVISVSPSVSIFPLVGKMDKRRVQNMQEKLLRKISQLKVLTLVIDMSVAQFLDEETIRQFFNLLNDGVRLMGCTVVLTGIRPDDASKMIEFGITVHDHIRIKGTLQQALKELGFIEREL